VRHAAAAVRHQLKAAFQKRLPHLMDATSNFGRGARSRDWAIPMLAANAIPISSRRMAAKLANINVGSCRSR